MFALKTLPQLRQWWYATPSRTSIIRIAIVAAALFVALTSIRLGVQGMYYDELMQGTSIFAYFGRSLKGAFLFTYGNIPLLDGSYNGALKSALYALYLGLSGNPFSVVSLRLFGIFTVAAGLLAFVALTAKRVSRGTTMLFLAFFLTDAVLLLATRHDHGPLAIAIALRLIFLAVMVRMATADRIRLSSFFMAGLIVGISVYDKLSNTVLLVPLALTAIIFASSYRTLPGMLSAAGGLAVGSIPLLLINIYSRIHHGVFISLERVGIPYIRSVPGFFLHLWEYVGTGSSLKIQWWIVGTTNQGWQRVLDTAAVEALCMIGLITCGYLWLRRQRAGENCVRLIAVLLCSYVGIAFGLYALPVNSALQTHHWIIGTPFQYLALALLFGTPRPEQDRRLRIAGTVLLSVLFFVRVWTVIGIEQSLLLGRSNSAYDPSLTKIGELAAKDSDHAVFVAQDWGIGKQIFVMANGMSHHVYEPFWKYKGVEEIYDIMEESGKTYLYLVMLRNPWLIANPENTARIGYDLTHAPEFRELIPEERYRNLAEVLVRKFEYRK